MNIIRLESPSPQNPAIPDPTLVASQVQEHSGDTFHGQVSSSFIGGHHNLNTINIHHHTDPHPNINKEEGTTLVHISLDVIELIDLLR